MAWILPHSLSPSLHSPNINITLDTKRNISPCSQPNCSYVELQWWSLAALIIVALWLMVAFFYARAQHCLKNRLCSCLWSLKTYQRGQSESPGWSTKKSFLSVTSLWQSPNTDHHFVAEDDHKVKVLEVDKGESTYSLKTLIERLRVWDR